MHLSLLKSFRGHKPATAGILAAPDLFCETGGSMFILKLMMALAVVLGFLVLLVVALK